MFFAQSLKWYKRPEVQEALVMNGCEREISVMYGAHNFGRRPDVLAYPGDVLAFAQKKATSFHCSEERWSDPLKIETGMSRRKLDDLRIGWDLVLDIDCPHWEFSKLTAHLFITALKEHGISTITCKFSGNKGFHIGVPFESFPTEHNGAATKDLFPEAPRAIASYLLDYIEEHYVRVQESRVTIGGKRFSMEDLKAISGNELLQDVCPACKHPKKRTTTKTKFVCPSCEERAIGDTQFMKCPSCATLMERFTTGGSACTKCGNTDPPIRRFNVAALIEVDTILLASRHLYRMPYSLHEKTGLVSIVIDPDQVLAFEKETANPGRVKQFTTFLPRDVQQGEGAELLGKAMLYQAMHEDEVLKDRKSYEAPEDAIDEKHFPPCIRKILRGLRDGKKRALFILTNFLYSCGWSPEMIKDRVYDWNEQNPEKLREVVIKSHLQLKEKKREIILPPNCTSDYYKAIGVCNPDDFCKLIKNPAQYALRKHKLENFRKDGSPKVKRTPLTEEQKEARRKHRERLKKEKAKTSPDGTHQDTQQV